MPRTRQPNCDMMMSMQNGPCITVSDPLRLNCWFHLSNGTCPSRHTIPGLLQRPSDHSQLSKPQNNGFYLWQTVHWFTIQLPASIPTWTQCPTTYGCGIGWYYTWEYGPDRQRCWTGKKVAEPHSPYFTVGLVPSIPMEQATVWQFVDLAAHLADQYNKLGSRFHWVKVQQMMPTMKDALCIIRL